MTVYEQVYFDNDGLLFLEEFLFPEKKGDVDELLSSS